MSVTHNLTNEGKQEENKRNDPKIEEYKDSKETTEKPFNSNLE